MTVDLEVDRLNWDAWNLQHIAKHKVLPEEAEEVASSNPVMRRSYKDRFQLLGSTLSGRMLSIIVGEDPNRIGVFYVFNARPASRRERLFYHQQRGGTAK